MKKRTPQILIACVAIAIAILFQNCSPVSMGDGGSTAQSSPSGAPPTTTIPATTSNGNGGGYLGKLYLNVLTASTCGDGSKINAMIFRNAGVYTLVRNNCTDITPMVIPNNSIIVLQVGDSISYGSLIFESTANNLPPTAPIMMYCQSGPTTTGLLSDILIRTDRNGYVTVGNMTTPGGTASGPYLFTNEGTALLGTTSSFPRTFGAGDPPPFSVTFGNGASPYFASWNFNGFAYTGTCLLQ